MQNTSLFDRLLLLIFLLTLPSCAWRRWTPTELYPDEGVKQAVPKGGTNWSYQLRLNSPGPRAAHSMLYWNNSVYLFGGRGNEISVPHDPRTYEVARANGSLYFKSYDQRHFSDCKDENGVSNNDPSYIGKEFPADRFANCYNVRIGTYFNDVWRYDLSCERRGGGVSFKGAGEGYRPEYEQITDPLLMGRPYKSSPTLTFDGPCEVDEPDVRGENALGQDDPSGKATGWKLLSFHAVLGGCRINNQTEECSHPHERHQHAAAILNKTTVLSNFTNEFGVTIFDTREEAYLIVYGGFSRMCEDTCNDMWALNLAECQRENERGLVGRGPGPETLRNDYRASRGLPPTPPIYCNWEKFATLDRIGPGNRGRAASTSDSSLSLFIIFGGLRLWQGFAQANDLNNFWKDTTRFPFGGYLDDLWIFSLDPAGPSTFFGERNTDLGTTLFKGAMPTDVKTGEWRIGKTRDIPSGNEALKTRDLLLGEPVVTKFGAWQQVLPREACYTYPGQLYTERNNILCSITWPPARADGTIAKVNEFLYLFGGYSAPFPYPHVKGRGSGPGVSSLSSDSAGPYPTYPYYLSDLWRFDFVSGSWTEIKQAAGEPWPQGRRGHTMIRAGEALIVTGGYSENVYLDEFWIYNISANFWLKKEYHVHPLLPEECTTDVMIDPTDPLGLREILITETTKPSVYGIPTFFDGNLDGKFGRATTNITIPQYRRASPGWDGCRHRFDKRLDLPTEMQWERPSPRAFASSIFVEDYDLMLMYGGETGVREELPTLQITHEVTVNGELWEWGRFACPSNCTGHGDCWYGYCYCFDGFYGIDCSNHTCPGTSCIYNSTTHKQDCIHCASLPYVHTDEDPSYIEGMRKVPITYDSFVWGLPVSERKKYTHGICDGFGKCQCSPPFLTDDCSVKDCMNNCSGPLNGECIVEYPIARCACIPPATGDNCSIYNCPNNCSAHGVCNINNGTCTCDKIKSPYNRKIYWDTYAGPDCSYVRPFAGASIAQASFMAIAVAFIGLVFVSNGLIS